MPKEVYMNISNDIKEGKQIYPIKNYAEEFLDNLACKVNNPNGYWDIWNDGHKENNVSKANFTINKDNNNLYHMKINKQESDTELFPYFAFNASSGFIKITENCEFSCNVNITDGFGIKVLYYLYDANRNAIGSRKVKDISGNTVLTIGVSDADKPTCAYIKIDSIKLGVYDEVNGAMATKLPCSCDLYNFGAKSLTEYNTTVNLADMISNIDDKYYNSEKILNSKPWLYENNGEIIYLFDKDISTNQSRIIDKKSYINNKSLKVITAKGTTKTYKINSLHLPIEQNDSIGFYIHADRSLMDKKTTINISFNTDDGSLILYHQLDSDGSTIVTNMQNGWYFYKYIFDKSVTINSISIAVTGGSNSSDGGDIIYFDSVIKNRKLRPKVLLCFDNWSSNLSLAQNLLETYGFKATFAISNENTHESFRSLYDSLLNNGWDVSYYGGNGTRPEDSDSQDAWNSFICQGMNNLIYSGCKKPTAYFAQYNKSTEKIINACKRAGFKMMRIGSYSNKYIDEFNYDSFEIPSIIASGSDPTTVINEIDNAINRGSSLCIFAHQILDELESDDNVNVLEETYVQILDKIKSCVDSYNLHVITFSELANEFGIITS